MNFSKLSRPAKRLHQKIKQAAIAIIAVAGIFLSAAPAHAADAPPLKFNPAACSQGAKDQFYIALGRAVFAIPSPRNLVLFPDRKPILISTPAGDDIKLVPPVPTDPVGCLGNPQQMISLEWPEGLFVGDGPDKAQLHEMNMGHMTLARIGEKRLITEDDANNATWSADQDRMWDSTRLGWTYSKKGPFSVCTLPTTVIKRLPGITICTRSDAPENTTPILYILKTPVYSTPRGGDFLLMCPGNPNRRCETGYITVGNYGLTYQIWQNGLSSNETIKEAVSFDRRLRQVIENHRVKNYQWPEQHATLPNK